MALGNATKPLKDIRLDIIIIERNIAIPTLFEQLVESKNHMALVVDEYGSVSGIVTMEDVIETLLGLEIMDESDHVANLQALARKSWEVRAKRLGLISDTPEEN
jgi:CBS domain containing-hemolysin-like protein